MGLVAQLEILDELGQDYLTAEHEEDSLMLGDRAARNWQAARLADCTSGPDAVWSWGNLMFAQVVTGLAPYGRKAGKRWMPDPKVLRETW